jgi:hypothetical protein
MKYPAILIVLGLFILSCKKDNPEPEKEEDKNFSAIISVTSMTRFDTLIYAGDTITAFDYVNYNQDPNLDFINEQGWIWTDTVNLLKSEVYKIKSVTLQASPPIFSIKNTIKFSVAGIKDSTVSDPNWNTSGIDKYYESSMYFSYGSR